ncbi:phage tail tape measure protein [Pantoea sp. SORGH_AS_0659]|uniref:phage tail tape measure protein n=1 Tax=Pantoea sp. SORGH_AS_0659 TaxID=3062597 RepID=UPI0028601CA9|nr:phage tail tape measure protein [Pantoea sp. SORGH_AS_0659]MDR6348533.1 TP901 family phage tail tape measure protein [Pantoea sp. SORGH_AS_0659]
MTDRNLSIRVAFDAVNKLTSPASAAQKSAAALASQIRDTQSSLKSMERNAASFDRLTRASQKTSQQLNEAKNKAKELRDSFGPASQRTEEQTAALKRQSESIRQLTRAQNEERAKLGALSSSMLRHGIVLRNGSTATEQISRRTGEYNRQLSEQQRRLAAVSRAQGNYERAKERRDSLTGGGMKAVVAGAATVAPVVKSLTSYASMEDAMKDVAKQVNDLRDASGNRTAQYYDLQKSIKAASETLPMENGAQDYAALVAGGARMGVSNSDDPWEKQKADLMSFANTAAMAATSFDLPAGELSESLGKIAGLYKVPTQNIEQLGDALNYLDDNAKSKGADIIDVLQRVGGIADKLDYRKAAALGSTFLTLGAAPEIAASATNAMVRELAIATTQGQNFTDGLNSLGLSAEKIQKAMPTDAMGTIITVLEAAKKLSPDKQTSVLTQIFGKEFGDDAAKLANNLPELYRQLQLVNGEASKGSMRRESDINKDSVSAQYLIAKAAMNNSFSSLGETLRGPAMSVIKYVTQITQRFRAWAEANPAVVASLLKVAAVIGVALAIMGSLALAIGAVLVPLGAMRLGLTLLGGGRGFGGALASLAGMAARFQNIVPASGSAGEAFRSFISLFSGSEAAEGVSWLERIREGLGALKGGDNDDEGGILNSFKGGALNAIKEQAENAGQALVSAFRNPLQALTLLRAQMSAMAATTFATFAAGASKIGTTLMWVATSPLAAIRYALIGVSSIIGFLLSPIGLLVAAVAAAALLIWKYWSPIKAFFSGFFDGLITGLAPVRSAFSGLVPVFEGIGNAISGVWNWFKNLFEPVKTSADSLKECTEAGQSFGVIVGNAVSSVLSVIIKVAEGIGYLLKKLGAIPEAANAAKEVANVMDAAAPAKPKAPIMYIWDDKQKKMVAQAWNPVPATTVAAAVQNAPPKPPASPPTASPASASGFDALKGTNPGKKKKSAAESATDVSAAARDPDKLGEIVFKDHPPVLPVVGDWQEPTISTPASSMAGITQRVGDMVRGIATWPTRALSAAMPVPITPAGRSNPDGLTTAAISAAAGGDVINLTINFYESAKMDEKSLASAVRRELDGLMRERDNRRRSQLRDRE